MPIFLICVCLAVAFFSYRYMKKRRTRTELLASQLSNTERAIVAKQVPLTQKLPPELRHKLEGKISLFLHQVEFIGCNGLEVTDEMRFSISAQACLLVVNTDTWYKHLRTILIYPSAFKSKQIKQDGYIVTEVETVRIGESWARGPVVLSWAHTEKGAIKDDDGHNVVFHEFAHQLDDLSGQTNGIPILSKGQSFADWNRVFVKAYENHLRSVEQGENTVLDAYGAQGPEEFFAVAVEVFFEKPKELHREELDIYRQLAELFNLEPLDWG